MTSNADNTKQPIKMVGYEQRIILSKAYIDELRAGAENHLEDLTDEQIVESLAEDILDRYFNVQYFDIDALYENN